MENKKPLSKTPAGAPQKPQHQQDKNQQPQHSGKAPAQQKKPGSNW